MNGFFLCKKVRWFFFCSASTLPVRSEQGPRANTVDLLLRFSRGVSPRQEGTDSGDEAGWHLRAKCALCLRANSPLRSWLVRLSPHPVRNLYAPRSRNTLRNTILGVFSSRSSFDPNLFARPLAVRPPRHLFFSEEDEHAAELPSGCPGDYESILLSQRGAHHFPFPVAGGQRRKDG